ncbi:MazG nucleotide pyrophosphohydrolase domain-containing protein [Bifidobacterium animalis subsp. animalis]|nr:MazG nucleotide pyrophosphohydrolase domain-containing protein [Bifidobacterium animalis subsp. animalis]KFI39599.1 MazG nucleotide pyrophosphohydrolase domain-containing protein [Bifidobacterium animalis subsp. animalis]
MAPMISDDTLRMIHQFSADRNWQQFHAPANMAKSVSIEAGELLECFQWSDEPRDGDWEHVYEELADVMIYCIQMADVLGVDLDEIIRDKMAKNAKKYPVEASHGSSAKAE